WPMAARACLLGMSVGFRVRFIFPTPMAMAPEDTSTISCPAFFRSLITLHNSSTRRIFSFPVPWVRVEGPIFITIRMAWPPVGFWRRLWQVYHRRGALTITEPLRARKFYGTRAAHETKKSVLAGERGTDHGGHPDH